MYIDGSRMNHNRITSEFIIHAFSHHGCWYCSLYSITVTYIVYILSKQHIYSNKKWRFTFVYPNYYQLSIKKRCGLNQRVCYIPIEISSFFLFCSFLSISLSVFCCSFLRFSFILCLFFRFSHRDLNIVFSLLFFSPPPLLSLSSDFLFSFDVLC